MVPSIHKHLEIIVLLVSSASELLVLIVLFPEIVIFYLSPIIPLYLENTAPLCMPPASLAAPLVLLVPACHERATVFILLMMGCGELGLCRHRPVIMEAFKVELDELDRMKACSSYH